MSTEPTLRAMGDAVWGRRVARLPERGVLLVCTDLHGNVPDYERMKALFFQEKALGNDPILAFCGDLVHGPDPGTRAAWPRYLGTPYDDRSAELILDMERFTRDERVFTLLGNHEHAHVGGPPVPKFYPDEAAVLEATLGAETERVLEFIRSFPLLAMAPNGLVLTHAAPRSTEPRADDFERLRYDGYRTVPLLRMADVDTLGALLWARMATEGQARRLLRALFGDEFTEGFVTFGHDVVHEGYDRFSASQICVSTSFGLDDERKTYLRLDLSQRYASAHALREGVELLPLYP